MIALEYIEFCQNELNDLKEMFKNKSINEEPIYSYCWNKTNYFVPVFCHPEDAHTMLSKAKYLYKELR